MTVRLIAGALIAVLARIGAAQQLVGTVLDSTSRQPIPGAVISLLDSAGIVLGRNITDARGDYRIVLPARVRRVRVMRIGFRPREATVPGVAQGATGRLDIAMISLPTFLEPIHVVENTKCPKRSDHAVALGLLEQARAGLLGTIVAREANPPKLVRLKYVRTMDGTSDKIVKQTVRIDSIEAGSRSFSAARSGAGFIERGFVEDSAGEQTYLGPDAETLLDEAFATGYCIWLADRDRARPTQIGLSFAAPARRKDRVDVDGTLWIDTAARALRDIEYRYVGLDRRIEALHPGGHIFFREIANGVVLIDRWQMLLFSAEVDTIASSRREVVRSWFYGSETGGEVARASWRDGFVWQASLGTLRVHGANPNGPVPRGRRCTFATRTTERRPTRTVASRSAIWFLVHTPSQWSTRSSRRSASRCRVESPSPRYATRRSTFALHFHAPRTTSPTAARVSARSSRGSRRCSSVE